MRAPEAFDLVLHLAKVLTLIERDVLDGLLPALEIVDARIADLVKHLVSSLHCDYWCIGEGVQD